MKKIYSPVLKQASSKVLSIEMEIAVALPQPHRNPKQICKVLLGEHRGLRPVSEDASFAQQNHPLDLRNDFGYVVRHQQNPQPGLRQLAHRVSKLHLRADIQRVAGLIKQ